jgi:hypothetical protein
MRTDLQQFAFDLRYLLGEVASNARKRIALRVRQAGFQEVRDGVVDVEPGRMDGL